MYNTACRQLVESFADGYNATIFAYGQTGSGKTHTMGTAANSGSSGADEGIIPRVVKHVFRVIESRRETHEYSLQVSFLEIHNEDIVDLLGKGRVGDKAPAELNIRETSQGDIQVVGAVREDVRSAGGALSFLESGTAGRATGSTSMNAVSSRSHAIFTVYLTQRKLKRRPVDEDPDSPVAAAPPSSSSSSAAAAAASVSAPADLEDEEVLTSKFHFVDLAGSERLKRTGATGVRMKEGININCGLLALGRVISALGDPARNKGHIPFRNSKITRLLQDSLGGNSQTMMIACVSPADINEEETLNTLQYANNAKNIRNTPVLNRDPKTVKLAEARARIAELERRLLGAGSADAQAQLDALGRENRSLRSQVEHKAHLLREHERVSAEAQAYSVMAQERFNNVVSALEAISTEFAHLRDLSGEAGTLAGAPAVPVTALSIVGEEDEEKDGGAAGEREAKGTSADMVAAISNLVAKYRKPPSHRRAGSVLPATMGMGMSMGHDDSFVIEAQAGAAGALEIKVPAPVVDRFTERQDETIAALKAQVAAARVVIDRFEQADREHAAVTAPGADSAAASAPGGPVESSLVEGKQDGDQVVVRVLAKSDAKLAEALAAFRALSAGEDDVDGGAGAHGDIDYADAVELRTMEAKLSELDRHMNSNQEKIDKLTQEKDASEKLATAIESFRAKCDEKERELASIRLEHEGAMERAKRGDKDKQAVEALTAKLKETTTQLDFYKRKVREAERAKLEHETAQKRLNELQEQLQAQKREKVNLARQLEEKSNRLRVEASQRERSVRSERRRVDESQNEIVRLQRELTAKSTTVKELQSEKKTLQARIALFEGRRANAASIRMNRPKAVERPHRPWNSNRPRALPTSSFSSSSGAAASAGGPSSGPAPRPLTAGASNISGSNVFASAFSVGGGLGTAVGPAVASASSRATAFLTRAQSAAPQLTSAVTSSSINALIANAAAAYNASSAAAAAAAQAAATLESPFKRPLQRGEAASAAAAHAQEGGGQLVFGAGVASAERADASPTTVIPAPPASPSNGFMTQLPQSLMSQDAFSAAFAAADDEDAVEGASVAPVDVSDAAAVAAAGTGSAPSSTTNAAASAAGSAGSVSGIPRARTTRAASAAPFTAAAASSATAAHLAAVGKAAAAKTASGLAKGRTSRLVSELKQRNQAIAQQQVEFFGLVGHNNELLQLEGQMKTTREQLLAAPTPAVAQELSERYQAEQARFAELSREIDARTRGSSGSGASAALAEAVSAAAPVAAPTASSARPRTPFGQASDINSTVALATAAAADGSRRPRKIVLASSTKGAGAPLSAAASLVEREAAAIENGENAAA